MRRFLAAVLVGAGALVAFRRRFRGLRRSALPPADPAQELKRKLEASRAAEPAAEPAAEAEPAAPELGLDERRRAVHDRGRSAIERMQPGSHDDDAQARPEV